MYAHLKGMSFCEYTFIHCSVIFYLRPPGVRHVVTQYFIDFYHQLSFVIWTSGYTFRQLVVVLRQSVYIQFNIYR
jgi:hypothetical protein